MAVAQVIRAREIRDMTQTVSGQRSPRKTGSFTYANNYAPSPTGVTPPRWSPDRPVMRVRGSMHMHSSVFAISNE